MTCVHVSKIFMFTNLLSVNLGKLTALWRAHSDSLLALFNSPAGVLPWAAATHCAFGLWMHTRFNAGHVGGEQISGLASSAGAGAVSLSNTYYFRRISQANGLPLLVLLIVHLTMHVFIRWAPASQVNHCTCCSSVITLTG